MAGGVSQRGFMVTCSGNGVSWGTWDTCTGGNKTREVTPIRRGGRNEISLIRGPGSWEDVTVGIQNDPVLARAVARADTEGHLVVVVKQPLDERLSPAGEPEVWQGLIKEVHTPDFDANSTGQAVLEFVMTPSSGPA